MHCSCEERFIGGLLSFFRLILSSSSSAYLFCISAHLPLLCHCCHLIHAIVIAFFYAPPSPPSYVNTNKHTQTVLFARCLVVGSVLPFAPSPTLVRISRFPCSKLPPPSLTSFSLLLSVLCEASHVSPRPTTSSRPLGHFLMWSGAMGEFALTKR